jgi:hypothetical protein
VANDKTASSSRDDLEDSTEQPAEELEWPQLSQVELDVCLGSHTAEPPASQTVGSGEH